jgi:hypothetical protein
MRRRHLLFGLAALPAGWAGWFLSRNRLELVTRRISTPAT